MLLECPWEVHGQHWAARVMSLGKLLGSTYPNRDYPPPDLLCGPARVQQPVSSRPDPGLAGSASKQQAASQQQAGPGPRGVRH